jgi:hypothetical protein
MILYDSVVSGSLVVSSSITANAPLTISGSTASSGILFGSSFWQIASAGASLTYNGGTGYIFNAGTSNPYKFNFANNTLMQLTGSTGALMLQNSGSFVDNGYRLQVQTGASGSLWVSGSAVFSGSVSVVGNLTSTGTITAQTLVVQTITSSVEYSSGSNVFGSNTGNTHQFTGSILVSGSQTVNGNVGIGTVSPSDKLNVVVSSNGNAARFDGPTSGLILQTNATTADIIAYGGTTPSYRTLNFATSATTAMSIISGSGNVGIGTTNPTVALEISTGAGSGANRVLLKPTTDYAFYQINNTAGTTYIGTDNSTGAVFGNGAYAMNIYNSYAGNINFYTNSALRMSISSSGNIGIGTSSPSYQLDVNGTGRFSSTLNIGGVTDIQSARTVQLTLLKLSTTTLSSDINDEVSIDFGRGEMSKYSGRVSGYISNYSTYDGGLKFYSSTGGTLNASPSLTIASTGAATFSSSVTAADTISVSNGNLYPRIRVTSTNAGSSAAGFEIADNTGTQWAIAYDKAGSGLQFFKEGSGNRFYITNGGNVGIGTAAPTFPLEVYATSSDVVKIWSNQTNVDLWFKDSGTTAGNNRIRSVANSLQIISGGNTTATFTSGGVVSINSNSPNTTYALGIKVTGTTVRNGIDYINAYQGMSAAGNAFSYYNDVNALVAMQVLGNGNLVNYNNSYGAISDIKLKENISDATPKLNDLMQLKVRNFNFKTDSNNRQIGFIAQEFEEVFPSLIEETLDRDINGVIEGTSIKTIKTSVLIPILVKAIQELSAKVAALEAQQ